MANESICQIVEVGTLELETKGIRKHVYYNGVVVTEDTCLVTSRDECNIQLYSLRDGKQLSSHRLESRPMDICLISKTEVVVCLSRWKIVILSFKSKDHVKLVKTLDASRGFNRCHSVVKLNSDKLVVSGWKYGNRMLCWVVLSITDGRLESSHDICKGYRTHMAIKGNTLYISCRTLDSTSTGVHVYDISNPYRHMFLYQHQELKSPSRIMAGRESIFVCDRNSNRIHQLTLSSQLVAIHTVSTDPYGIFYDDPHGSMYSTRHGSNKITVYRVEYLHQPGVPVEILKMDDRSIQLFEDALKDGKETVHSLRIMVVGHMGVGKTTLVKRLLGEEVNISERRSTEGIDIYVNCCEVSLSTHEWTRRTKGQDYRLQRIAKVLNEQYSVKGSVTDEQAIIPPEGDRTESLEDNPVAVEDQDTEVLHHHSPEQDIGQNLFSATNRQEESHAHQQEASASAVDQQKPTQSETNTIAMLKLLKENVNKLEGTGEHSLLTIWDFAGQYAFYTTHQTFLTRRAIYLLVSDVSGQLTDLVADESNFDSDGIMKCQVHELNEVWLNSVHSCASSPEASSPPVILVGTHLDKISQILIALYNYTDTDQGYLSFSEGDKLILIEKSLEDPNFFKAENSLGEVGLVPSTFMQVQDNHYEISERYFKEIRFHLRDKPTRFHLIDEDFAIDNTVVDRKLEDLKRKIVDVASQQPYWGEVIPARWLLLEQELMRRKADGMKVISRKDVEKINKQGTVKIESSDELDLFLIFLHETGTIIYFSHTTIVHYQ